MLTRADFDLAVRDALRQYARADLLLRSPLMGLRTISGHGSKTADVVHLQRALSDAAEAIFVNERDQKLLRVLELTYFRSRRNNRPWPSGWGFPSVPIVVI